MKMRIGYKGIKRPSPKVRMVNSFLKNFNEGRLSIKNATLYSNGKTHMKVDTLENVLGYNATGSDAYFVVNPGGTKEGDIKKLVAVFTDLDAGRDKNGKYLAQNQVNIRKGKMLKRIEQFPLKPTYIVETRNGYQVYWLLKNTAKNATRLNRWNTVQSTINKFFQGVGADTRVVKCNQIMRLPYTTWYKKWEGVKKSYNVELLPAYSESFSNHTARKYKLDDFKFEWRYNKTPANLKFMDAPSRKNNSYHRVAPIDKTASPPYNRQEKEADEEFIKELKEYVYPDAKYNLEPVIRTIEFLRDVNPFLFRQGNKFMAKSATALAFELSKTFNVS